MKPSLHVVALSALMVAAAGPAAAKTHHHHHHHHHGAKHHHAATHHARHGHKAHSKSGSDADFLKKALEGDNSEMRLGRLAEQQGHAAGVKAYGRTLARDHAAARRQVEPVAKAHGLAITSEMAPEARAEYDKLERMHGWAFDQEFARYMVKDHRQDISDFEKQARKGDRSTRRLAEHTLPTLRKHLRLAEKLSRR